MVVALALLVALPALDPVDARHLLARTGFGPTRAEIGALSPLSREQAVDRIVDGIRVEAVSKPPSFAKLVPFRKPESFVEKAKFAVDRQEEANELKQWWANEMLTTPSPFTEHLVLFWSNHFTSSFQKVRVPELLYEQNELLRREAGGNFRRMLHEIVDDRAMLLYLDGAKNQAKAPNENFARELLELFTLGEGHYTEKDVQEAARALSGTTISPLSGAVIEPFFRHDRKEKTFLGHTGNLDKNDVVEILLANPRTAEFVVEKLWREFISPTPDPKEVARFAAVLRDNNYELKPLYRVMFDSDAFWSKENRGALVKSPVDLLVGSARSLELLADGDGNPSPQWIVGTARDLGQDLFDPPNVKGWPGGDRWVTALTLPHRERLAREAVSATRLSDDDGAAKSTRVSMATLLLPLPSVDGDRDLESIARDPAFQLK